MSLTWTSVCLNRIPEESFPDGRGVASAERACTLR